MKTLFLTFILTLSTLAVVAQVQVDTTIAPLKRFYVGVELSSISYTMWNPSKRVGGGVTPVLHLNAGYKLAKSLNLQVGLTYGRKRVDELSGIYYGQNDTIINHYRKGEIQALSVPLTVLFTPFSSHQNQRLRISATASLVPIFGSVWHQQSEEFEGEKKVTYDDKDSGVYGIVTAGLQLNYKISNRLDGFGKVNLYYKNIGHNSYYASIAKSIGIGVNYNL
ncbi:hypothetical protein H7F15_00470 [Pontibacter sp. Tf4]|uniref:hypothetical protein n=1 Tax=Pontibacter sp. Tf4 TaxID=2761620 RepID=UPI001628AF1B|nr:hypothetical protein [Pontibacter sp. Tf4]MBB6609498.1 hypothetical protein [Pontibacter sp. Tf4]